VVDETRGGEDGGKSLRELPSYRLIGRGAETEEKMSFLLQSP
jgi:hypothetical protein